MPLGPPKGLVDEMRDQATPPTRPSLCMQGLGPLVDMSVETSDDGMTLYGRAEFEEVCGGWCGMEYMH